MSATGLHEQAAMILDGAGDAYVELRAVHPRIGGQVRRGWYTLEQLADLARRAHDLAAAYNVWIGAAPRARHGGGGADDVAFSANLWADCDTAPSVGALARVRRRPTLEIRTSTLAGEHRQAWWRLDRRLEPGEIDSANRRLARALGADTGSCDRAHVLRAAGTVNHKRATPEAVEAVAFSGEIHDTTALLQALPAAAATAADIQISATAGCGDHEARAALVPHGERHPYLVDFAVRLARGGVLDVERLHAHLRLEYERYCEPGGPGGPRDTYDIARWAVRTRVAQREAQTDG